MHHVVLMCSVNGRDDDEQGDVQHRSTPLSAASSSQGPSSSRSSSGKSRQLTSLEVSGTAVGPAETVGDAGSQRDAGRSLTEETSEPCDDAADTCDPAHRGDVPQVRVTGRHKSSVKTSMTHQSSASQSVTHNRPKVPRLAILNVHRVSKK